MAVLAIDADMKRRTGLLVMVLQSFEDPKETQLLWHTDGVHVGIIENIILTIHGRLRKSTDIITYDIYLFPPSKEKTVCVSLLYTAC